uniref:Periplasmic heavy metal sensor n=1 Tax=Geobacter sp. (strain M21) TaxID=443144 RepID=C6E1C3_GEOSM
MEKISSSVLLFALACSAAPPVFGDEMKMSGDGASHGHMEGDYDPKKSFEDFSRKLALSQEQREKIRPILNREVDEMKKVHAEAREKTMRIMEEHQRKVMGHLTPQQKEKYRTMITERKMKMEQMMKEHHGMMGGAAIDDHESKQGRQ